MKNVNPIRVLALSAALIGGASVGRAEAQPTPGASVAGATLETGLRLLRAPVLGPRYFTGLIVAFSTISQDVVLVGGSVTNISLDGDGSSDLDLFLYDESGHLIDVDLGPTDQAFVSVRPLWTGRFTIVIRNRGSEPNSFRLSAE